MKKPFNNALLATFVFLFQGSLQLFAQTATFSNLRLDMNVPDNNGNTMLQFHFSMTVSGAKGHNVRPVMFVDIPMGTSHRYIGGNQMRAEGSPLGCSWDPTYTSGDWWIGIYNSNLNPLPGTNTYYTRIGAYDETLTRYIGWSDYLTYDMTGSSPSNNNGPQLHSIICPSCGGAGRLSWVGDGSIICKTCGGAGLLYSYQ